MSDNSNTNTNINTNELLHKHLQQISDTYDTFTPIDHRNHLKKLKNRGFEPLVIYDIGAGVLTWTRCAKELWPDALFIVFDAFEHASFIYEEHEVEHYIGVLGNRDNKLVKFYQNEYYVFGSSYYRDVDYQTFGQYDLNDYLKLPMYTLDTVVERNEFPWPDLIKISVEGSEKDVIEGAAECLSQCERLIVNMYHEPVKLGAPRVYQTLPYISQLGWGCDAPCFCDNGNNCDYGFYNKNFIRGVFS